MTMKKISIKPLIKVIIGVLLFAFIMNNYNMPQSVARNGSGHKQAQHQQDFSKCINKSLDKMMNGYLNFSDPDPISHCYDQLLNNGNETNNNGGGSGGNGNNNLNNNSSFTNV